MMLKSFNISTSIVCPTSRVLHQIFIREKVFFKELVKMHTVSIKAYPWYSLVEHVFLIHRIDSNTTAGPVQPVHICKPNDLVSRIVLQSFSSSTSIARPAYRFHITIWIIILEMKIFSGTYL